jgi:hypothetical protein
MVEERTLLEFLLGVHLYVAVLVVGGWEIGVAGLAEYL